MSFGGGDMKRGKRKQRKMLRKRAKKDKREIVVNRSNTVNAQWAKIKLKSVFEK
jgi:hypothetical protein